MGRGLVENNRDRVPADVPTAVVLDQYSLWLEMVKLLAERAGVSVLTATTRVEEALAELEARRPTLFICGLERGALAPTALNDLLGSAASIPDLVTLVVGSNDEPEFIERCLATGAYAYVLKTVEPQDLSAAIRQAVERSVYLFARPSGNGTSGLGSKAPTVSLTARELDVLRLVAEGLSNAQVARRLWISEPTVKYHLSRTYEKLGVSNRTGAARWAERHGLLEASAELSVN
jgi:DNA-binding NarL/FixJ family response regulator